MIIPTLLPRKGVPGPVGDIANTVTQGGKDVANTATNVAPTVTNVATNVATTATEVGKTATEVGKGVAQQGGDAVNLFKEGTGLMQQFQEIMDYWKAHQKAIVYVAIALLVLIIISLLISIWTCIRSCVKCCCMSEEHHHNIAKEERHAPPKVHSMRCGRCHMCHWDPTFIARCCGNIPILATEKDKWNFWGHQDGWFRSLGRCEAKWPGKRSWKEWRARMNGEHVREEFQHLSEKGKAMVESGKHQIEQMRGRSRSRYKAGQNGRETDVISPVSP